MDIQNLKPTEPPTPSKLKEPGTNNAIQVTTAENAPANSAKVAKQKKKKKKKEKKPRCCFEGCRRKLSLTDQSKKCRCNMIFCSHHFPVEEHKCTFDYKAFSRKQFEERAGLGGGQFKKVIEI
tara:strand:+ start:296 stop:664 length:369 start_codon:yes stop_codon:yes gene_type:complete